MPNTKNNWRAMYLNFAKPLLDKVAALLLLVLTAPVMILVIILLWISNQGRVWFVQPRPGLHGKTFNIVKFRTMSEAKDSQGRLLPDEVRLTTVGRLVRKFSLDEIPQLFNVLKGDMSVVGPRPLLVEYLPLYNDRQRRRHLVRPGITGWAQVNGRNAVDWKRRFELDEWYVDHVSFWVDLRILLITLWRVIRAEGISSGTSATMERFQGND